MKTFLNQKIKKLVLTISFDVHTYHYFFSCYLEYFFLNPARRVGSSQGLSTNKFCHTYNNVLVRPIKYFCASSNFSTYRRTHIQCRTLQRGWEVLGVCQQITFATINRFCLLTKPPISHPLTPCF